MPDCTTVMIWKTICDRVAELLPTARVVRTYNAVSKFAEVKNSDGPVVFVTLEGKSRERITNARIYDVLDFSVWITQYVPAQAEAEIMAAMDTCLAMCDTVADAFSQRRTVTAGGLSFVFSDEAEVEGDKAFDLNDFAEYSVFSIMYGIRAKFERAG